MRKIIRKFKFSDLALAFKVRGNMYDALVRFDQNQNELFDEFEIKKALVTILKQDQNQVHYVVNNVFRYDRDDDGSITYPQFTNFSVEQHFGQMAIQRLHRKGFYVNGARRIMNLQQFQTTLNYCLDTINSKGTHAQYERLFNQVDLDHDGMISYQDYFVFLREYFGSQSQAFQEEEKNPSPRKPKPPPFVPPVVPPIQFQDGNGQTPQQRFAKLVYSQFKITVMERDRNKNLILERQQFQDILTNIFKLSYNQKMQLEEKFISGSNTAKYEDFMRAVVTSYMSQISAQKFIQGQGVSQNEFIEVVNKACHFIAIKPADHILKACFQAGSRGSAKLNKSGYSNLMKNIFQNFKFDSRGLPTTRPKSQRFESIAPKNYY